MSYVLDMFTLAYVEAMLWSSTDNSDESGGEPLDANYSASDLAPEAMEKVVADCARFQREHWEDIASDVSRAGHDFWLTRNHHGAGFWDGDWTEEIGERLTEAAHGFGEVTVFVGDDGRLYFL